MRALVPTLAVLALLAGACASTESDVPTGLAGVLAGQELPEGSAVLLLAVPDATVPDADEQPVAVPGSGLVVRAALRQALEGAGRTAVVSEATSLVEGWQDARRLHCDHVLEATLTGWEDTSSEWREHPDRLAVRLEIWRASDRVLVAWADKEVVGRTPQDLKQTPHTLAPRLVAELLDPILTGAVVPPPDDGEG